MSKVGQNHIYIRFTYGIFGGEVIKHTVIYGVYIRFWPTLLMRLMGYTQCHQQSVLPFIAPLRIPTKPSLPQNMSPLSQNVVQSACVVLYFHPAHILQDP